MASSSREACSTASSIGREPPVNRLMTVMGACVEPAFVQLALTPAPALFERYAQAICTSATRPISRARRREHLLSRDRSMVEDAELRGGLDVQHRPLFFADLRVIAPSRATCERIASELRAVGAENRLVERGTAVRHGLLGLYARAGAARRGQPAALVAQGRVRLDRARRAVAAARRSTIVARCPLRARRRSRRLATARRRAILPPARRGPPARCATRSGPVSIHPELRRQNTAVPGTVEQGKSSYLVATVAEDLRRERCAVIVLDPKGDAAEAAVSLVPPERDVHAARLRPSRPAASTRWRSTRPRT